MNTNNFAYQLNRFLTTYAVGQRNLSKNTVLAYRDTFSKFLQFFEEQGIVSEKLDFPYITREKVEEFLTWLEESQGCGASTRNLRLAGLKSFFNYVKIVCPEQLLLCGQVLNDIHTKKSPKPFIRYLNKDGIALLLAQPNLKKADERRDLALLSLLYDTGARVSEICNLTPQCLRFEAKPTVSFIGSKGNKSRVVPIIAKNAKIMRQHLRERKLDVIDRLNDPLFTNRSGDALSRAGVAYILAKYIQRANAATPNAISSLITPHCIRHSKAMHLLESGSNLIYIRDFLGHEEIETTQIYARANPGVKRDALENAYDLPDAPDLPDWNDDPSLIGFLKGLGK